MTHSSQNFSTYRPCPSTRKITTADGSLITVTGLGNIPINPCIALKNVLHVPKLSTNLISIKKLTQDLNCTVIFCSNYCEFQDQTSERTIGRAKERDGLYYLDSPNNLNLVQSDTSHSNLLSNKDEIWLQHRRFGHPSFKTLKVMFPNLFRGLDIEFFSCNVCEFAKHKRCYLFHKAIKDVILLSV